ncbi:MAG: glycosyltransferase [Phormidesmis sp.]
MANPKVSVIIPAYNAIAYLPKTLASVQQQTFKDFEVLVIDDGSTDSTADWVNSLSDRNVQLIVQKNGGCASARNRGIQAARGDYIAFLDADDIWEPSKLEKQAHILETSAAVGVVNTWISNIDSQGQPIGNLGTPDAEGKVWAQVIEENPIMCGSAPMVRRQCFDAVGLFDQSLRSAEDWDMWIRLAKKYEFAVVKEPLVRYRIHPKSKSHNLQLHLQSRLSVIEKAFSDSASDDSASDDASASEEAGKNAGEKSAVKGGANASAKNRACGLAYLSVAYRALQNGDLKHARSLRRQSIRHYPALIGSGVFHRLGIILFLRRYLGDGLYERLLHSF